MNSNIHERPAELLQRLIRFDTTNPPGNEKACMQFIRGLLSDAGIESTTLARDPDRPNLVSRLPGRGDAPPLLLYGHVDVVPTADQQWSHPPFSGEMVDEYIWGRGALDMKGGIAMMLSAFLRAAHEGTPLAGDVLLCILSDEEAGGDDGARFVVERHGDQFANVRYALGEFGAFALHIGGHRFYPIMVAEKQPCWIRAQFVGPAGHGSRPIPGTAMADLAHVLGQINRKRLPAHITPTVRQTVQATASRLPPTLAIPLKLLLVPGLTDRVLDVMGRDGLIFDAMLHNTVCPTMVRGGEKLNVIPSQIDLHLDGRILPGFGPDDIISELSAVVGDTADLQLLRHDSGPGIPDMGLFGLLSDILVEADPGSTPMPYTMPGASDARFFSRLGIQTYGYLPMNLPAGFDFAATIHGVDERIPVGSLEFGSRAIYDVLTRFGSAS